MTCDLICCRVDRARADRGPGRRNLQPLYSPSAVVTRDTTADGGTTTSTTTEHAAVARMVAGDGGVGVLVPSGVRRHG